MLPVAVRLKAQTGARLVYDSHELYCEQAFSSREKRRWQRVERDHIGACDLVITVNDTIARELRARYTIPSVEVILNAVPLAATTKPARYFHDHYGLAPHIRVALFQGGLTEGRNLHTLVDAAGHLKSGNVVLVLMGDGELVAPLRRQIARRGLADSVFLHPAVAQSALPAITRSADAGLIPYQADCLNNTYCTPNKLFEFIEAGVPILASDLPELRKFVHNLHIGLVGDLSTPEHTARLIDLLFEDSSRLATWRTNLASVRQQLCWETEEKKLIRMFATLR